MKTLTPTGEKIVVLFKDEAEILVKEALSDHAKMSTKNGYAIVMNMLTFLVNSPKDIPADKRKMIAQCFLISCERAGYPEDTADTLREIMGWH